MSHTVSSEDYDRLRASIARDKSLPAGFEGLLVKDLNTLLKAYFDYSDEDLRVVLTPLAGEGYALNVALDSSRAKRIKLL